MKRELIISFFLLIITGCSTNSEDGDKKDETQSVELTLIWEDSLKQSPSFYPPHYSDGMVFVFSGSDVLTAFNAQDGQIVWKYDGGLKKGSGSRRVFSDEQRVYATVYQTKGAQLICFNKFTGEILFQVPNYVANVNVVDNKHVYAVGKDMGFIAYDKYNGEVKWRHYLPGGLAGRLWDYPTVVDDTLYLAVGGANTQGLQGYLTKLNKNTGALIYAAPVKLASDSHNVRGPLVSPAIHNNLVIVESSDSRVYAFDRKTGKQVWRYNHKGAIRCTPVVDEGIIYYATQDTWLFALDAQTGQELWKTDKMLGSCNNGPPVIYKNYIFVFSSDSHMYCFDKKSGAFVFKKLDHLAPIIGEDHLFVAGYYDPVGNIKYFIKAYKINLIKN